MDFFLKKDIAHPFGFVRAGTKAIIEGDYFYFPYEGRTRSEEAGWMGNSYMIHASAIEDLIPEWIDFQYSADSQGDSSTNRT